MRLLNNNLCGHPRDVYAKQSILFMVEYHFEIAQQNFQTDIFIKLMKPTYTYGPIYAYSQINQHCYDLYSDLPPKR